MTNYRYTFDHGARKETCPACGHRTWRTLVSTRTGEPCDPIYGACDRINNCQHSAYPQTSEDHFVPLRPIPIPMPKITTWRCPQNLVDMTKDSRGNVFAKWLVKRFGQPAVDALRMYRVGTYPPSQKRPELSGSMVYWQISSDQKPRSGKVIPYDDNGNRIKDLGAVWIHSIAYPGKSMDDLGIGQCLFGEHLLVGRPDDGVCVVESEKSAIICAIWHPEFVWVATGGSHQFSLGNCQALTGRNVIVIPDVGMYGEWSAKALDLEPMCKSIEVMDFLEALGMEEGADIADNILDGGPDVPLPGMIKPEPEPEPEPEQPKRDDEWLAEMNEPVTPVEKFLSKPGVQSLVEGLDLDLTRVTLKPLEDGKR